MRRSLVVAVLLIAPPLSAQTIRGRVVDATSGEPVAQVAVAALDSARHAVGQARSASDGTFSMALRGAGSFHLETQRAGYQPTHTESLPVAARETLQVEVKVSASAIAVAPLTVTARTGPPHRQFLENTGFYDREKSGLGQFLRREDFEAHPNQTLAEVLSHTRGAYLMDTGPRQFIAFTRSSTTVSFRFSNANPCLPKVYLDGVRTPYDRYNDINAIVSPSQVEAVEMFRSTAEIPVEYGGSDASCGVILIWTKREQ